MNHQLSCLYSHLDRLEIQKARKLYISLESQLNRVEKRSYHDKLNEALIVAHRLIKEMMGKGDLKRADRVFAECGSHFHTKQLAELKPNYLNENNKPYSHTEREKQEQAKKLLKQIEVLLKASDFPKADHLYSENDDVIRKDKYENLKSKHIRSFFRKLDPKFSTDTEKANAIAKTAKNVQIKARAGSGKTTTLAFKTAFPG